VRIIGASLSDFHERAFAILVDAGVTHEEPRAALLALQPWLTFAVPLAIAWAATDRRNGLLVVAAAVTSIAAYICFNDFWPYAVLRLSLIHYVVWTLPIVTAGGVAGAMCLVRDRRWVTLGAALVSAVLVASLRLVASPVPPRRISIAPEGDGRTRYEIEFSEPQDLDAIDLGGAMASDPHNVTLKSFSVLQDGQPLEVYSGYRAIQLRDALRIGFNRHVEASRISLELDRTIANHPAKASDVGALEFTPTLVPLSLFRSRRADDVLNK